MKHKINKIVELQSEVKALKAQVESLKQKYDKLRSFKHDFSNIVLAVDGYKKANDYEGVYKMVDAMKAECKEFSQMEDIDAELFGNYAISNLINSKIHLAKQKNLNVNIESIFNLDIDKNDTYDVCRILGILLDNAIDAAKDTEEKIFSIRFINNTRFNRILIIVENSYNNKNMDINKIYEKGYSSKIEDKDFHGLGLWNIKNILENNDNLKLCTSKDSLFKQQLEIYTKTE